jgi:hypothetical protein
MIPIWTEVKDVEKGPKGLFAQCYQLCARRRLRLYWILFGPIYYIRDVGVAGSNPVTPTIDFSALLQPREPQIAHWVTTFRALGNRLGNNFPPFASRKVAPPFDPNPASTVLVIHNLSPS